MPCHPRGPVAPTPTPPSPGGSFLRLQPAGHLQIKPSDTGWDADLRQGGGATPSTAQLPTQTPASSSLHWALQSPQGPTRCQRAWGNRGLTGSCKASPCLQSPSKEDARAQARIGLHNPLHPTSQKRKPRPGDRKRLGQQLVFPASGASVQEPGLCLSWPQQLRSRLPTPRRGRLGQDHQQTGCPPTPSCSLSQPWRDMAILHPLTSLPTQSHSCRDPHVASLCVLCPASWCIPHHLGLLGCVTRADQLQGQWPWPPSCHTCALLQAAPQAA